MKHRRELLFASLPILFAVHQFIEGFVWLGLDGILSPTITHNMGAAFMLYAQGLLPFLLPLSVLLFEPDRKSRQRMMPFLIIGAGTALYILWALIAYPLQVFIRGNSIVYINPATNNTDCCGALRDRDVRFAVFLENQADDPLRRGQPGDSTDRHGGQALRLHLAVVRLRRGRQCDHPRLLLANPLEPALRLRAPAVTRRRFSGCPTLRVRGSGLCGHSPV